MSELTYTSGVTGQVFDLESKLSWGAARTAIPRMGLLADLPWIGYAYTQGS
ncbi:hypothetical protein ACTGNK_07925 [Bifidobacterium longum]